MHDDFSSRVSLIASIVLHKPYLSKEILSFAFTIFRLMQKNGTTFNQSQIFIRAV